MINWFTANNFAAVPKQINFNNNKKRQWTGGQPEIFVTGTHLQFSHTGTKFGFQQTGNCSQIS